MQNKLRFAILFCVVLLASPGCNPTTQLPNDQNTPSVQETPTPTPTSPLPNPISSPTPIAPASHYKVTGQEGETTYSGVVCDLEKPFALKANFEPWWEMNIDLTPASIKTGAYTLAGAMYDGSATFAGEGTYTLSPANDGAHQLTLKFTSYTTTTMLGSMGDVLASGPQEWHPVLVPLDTRECDGQ